MTPTLILLILFILLSALIVKLSSKVKTTRFYKIEDYWFIDLKWFPKAFIHHLAMVAGADQLLDKLAQGSTEVTLKYSSRMFRPKVDMDEILYKQNNLGLLLGAIYGVVKNDVYTEQIGKNRLWLCWVTLLVFGKYPERIFIQKV